MSLYDDRFVDTLIWIDVFQKRDHFKSIDEFTAMRFTAIGALPAARCM
jgi:hypothetical protein